MRNIGFYDTDAIDELATPTASTEITTDSPALEVFTDFNEHRPLVLEATTTAVEAERLMQMAHVRLKFVVDKNNHFLGVVSLDDLNSQEIVKKLSQGFNRDELSVTDFMRPRNELKAFDYEEVSKAKISDIIEALKSSGQQHCLVIDREKHKIRGIFSASDMARKLRLPINIETRSSFAHVFKVIHQ